MTRTDRFDRRTNNRRARDGAPWHIDMEPWWWRNRRQTRPERYHNRQMCRWSSPRSRSMACSGRSAATDRIPGSGE